MKSGVVLWRVVWCAGECCDRVRCVYTAHMNCLIKPDITRHVKMVGLYGRIILLDEA